jgi:hypothetical protein
MTTPSPLATERSGFGQSTLRWQDRSRRAVSGHSGFRLNLSVLYFPFRQTAPTDNDNGFFRFSAGSLNLQPEKAAEPLLRFARKCPME